MVTLIGRAVGLASIFVATTAVAETQSNLTDKRLLGRWCETGVYKFEPSRLVVWKNGEQWALRIEKVETGDDWINVIWDPRDGGKSTVYGEFGSTRMVQKGNPNEGLPRREFRRC
ncbi:MAG TPA: hypothetical protein VFW91_04210 [Candidatus Binatia bacterium]|jgi:hypothetical protein|nr:hypothetical protein [Candidatus Binatia bacterium]